MKRTVCVSLVGHLLAFGLFSLSFGRKLPEVNYTDIFFMGRILAGYDFNLTKFAAAQLRGNRYLLWLPPKDKKDNPFQYYLKPHILLENLKTKGVFIPEEAPVRPAKTDNKSGSIMFYPHLPYNFMFYFKDRQTVHMEIMFNISSQRPHNTVELKRKVASGNLEADLLGMRYIKHYLFIQQAHFAPNEWQKVKIDLSAQ